MQSSLRENEGHSCRLKGAFKVEYSPDKREGTACRGPENDSMFITLPCTPPRSSGNRRKEPNEKDRSLATNKTVIARFFIPETHLAVFISAVLSFAVGSAQIHHAEIAFSRPGLLLLHVVIPASSSLNLRENTERTHVNGLFRCFGSFQGLQDVWEYFIKLSTTVKYTKNSWYLFSEFMCWTGASSKMTFFWGKSYRTVFD